jgi:concanavalin A-like lectin/glucanase superfamily protein
MAALVILFSCQKLDRPPLGDYPTDTQTLPGGPLRFFVSFDKTDGPSPRWNAADSISGNPAQLFPFTTVQGVHGNAAQGVLGSAITYLNANDFAATAKSFTMALWLKTGVPHVNPQWVMSLVDKDQWSNSGLYLYFDHDQCCGGGSKVSTADSANMVLAVKENWFSFNGTDRVPHILDNQWHHLAFVYDATTSKLTTYLDGKALTGLSSAATTQAGLQGPVNFNPSTVSKLILGGWNKHAGIEGPTDPWIDSYPGDLDQFRLYNTALSATDILALYNSKQ